MLSLKISYNRKNIMLGKSMYSLKKIQDDLRSRYPAQQFPHGIVLKYQGEVITNDQQITNIASNGFSKSVKLEAEAAQPKALSIISEVESPAVEEISNNKKEEKNQQNQNAIQPQNSQKNAQDNIKVKEEEEEEENFQAPQSAPTQSLPVDEQKNQNIQQNSHIEAQVETQIKVQQTKKEEIKQTEPESAENKKQEEIPLKIPQNQQVYFKLSQSIENSIKKPTNIPSNQSYEPNAQNSSKAQLIEIQPGVYKCVFCKQFQICNVCDTKRVIYHNSKFVKLVNKLLQNKIEEKFVQMENRLLDKILFEKMDMIKKSQQQKLKAQKSEIKSANQISKSKILSNSFDVQDISLKNEFYVGEEFKWVFEIKPKKQIEIAQGLMVLDEKTGKAQYFTLKNNTRIEVGPFVIDKQGKFEKNYRLCLEEEDSTLQLFGPRFGFCVSIIKPKKMKVLKTSFREEIEILKKANKIEKSTDFLLQKFKEMGINEDNYIDSKAFLIDCMQGMMMG